MGQTQTEGRRDWVVRGGGGGLGVDGHGLTVDICRSCRDR